MKSMLEQHVVAVLEKLKPTIQEDGGDFEFLRIEESVVYIKFKGACIGCPFSFITLSLTIEEAVIAEVPEITEVIAE